MRKVISVLSVLLMLFAAVSCDGNGADPSSPENNRGTISEEQLSGIVNSIATEITEMMKTEEGQAPVDPTTEIKINATGETDNLKVTISMINGNTDFRFEVLKAVDGTTKLTQAGNTFEMKTDPESKKALYSLNGSAFTEMKEDGKDTEEVTAIWADIYLLTAGSNEVTSVVDGTFSIAIGSQKIDISMDGNMNGTVSVAEDENGDLATMISSIADGTITVKAVFNPAVSSINSISAVLDFDDLIETNIVDVNDPVALENLLNGMLEHISLRLVIDGGEYAGSWSVPSDLIKTYVDQIIANMTPPSSSGGQGTGSAA